MGNSGLSLKIRYRRDLGINDILFSCILVLMLGYFAITPLRNAQIRHVFVFGGSLFMYFVALYNMVKTKYSVAEFVRLTMMLLMIIAGIVITQENIVEATYAYLNFLALYIILTTRNVYKFRYNLVQVLYLFSIAVALCFFIDYLSPAAYVFEDGRSTGALVLGMTNPNLTGMMITGVIEMVMIGYKERKHKALSSLIVIALFYLCWLTESRSSLIACILALIYTLFFSGKKIPNIIVCLVVATPILFFPIYLALYRNGFNNLTLLGKQLFSGRQYTYTEYLNQLNTPYRWLFGDLGETLFSNAHNAPLMILCSIGLVGLFVTYYGLIRNLIILNNGALYPQNRVAIACILSVCIQSCGEALMFSGIFPSIGFMYIFMTLAGQSKVDRTQNEVTS